ncbi:alpha/beta fold hydrolase [Roseiconus nitratireducens]|uniref:Alpha/beta fold hydrolase n=1 Tax=Roseiconus nitratireducens TaxID=2605748 RepID=A0A5M6DE95_9BACT|nr:alpha/beta fold hydrolase [Roseiconus nitratireducens]KAA5545871.1 alpha/beta fold hydrolase [Roseiconus nitratireducens]
MNKQPLIAFLVFAALFCVCRSSMAQSDSELPQAVYLYEGDAPGSEGMSDIPKQIRPGDDRVVTQVHRPLLYPYLPAEGAETRMAVIVAPGGGHNSLWSTHEGHTPAKYFADHGIAAFVLEYRLAEERDSKYTVDEHALGDMQRAIRLVRARAKDWNVDPNRVGVMGFSAGGEIAALSGMRFDAGDQDADDSIAKQSSRPDFVALIYPGRSHRYEPQPESPPTFIVAGYGDRRDISEGMANVYLKYKRAGVPTELHIYSNAGHGFGLREGKSGSVMRWVDRFIDWAGDRKLIVREAKSKPSADTPSEPKPEDEASDLKIIRDIAYRKGDSQAWRLDLAMPAKQTKDLRPALVIVHGGGWRGGSKSVDVYQKMMTEYARKGYVTVNVEYRLIGEAPFPACIEDVKCAVRWLRAHAKEYHVDPDRIGAYGHSAGAHLALMLAMAPKSAGLEGDGGWDEFSSIVNVAAAGSPPTELGRDVPMAESQWWPIGYVAADHPPLFLIQGSEDRIVRAALTDDFVEKMKAAGADIKYLRVDGAQHGLAYNERLELTDPAIEEFFAKHLKPKLPDGAAANDATEPAAVIIEDGGTGPYSAIATEDESLSGMTIFRPRDLSPFGEKQKLPVLLWGNGACANTTEEHKNFLSEIASHGYLVLAIGLLDQIEERDETSRQKTLSSQLLAALDWAIAESERSGSQFDRKIDTSKVAAMGMSCGGLQAIEVSHDPRISTTVVCNSGVLPSPSPMPGMPALKKDILTKLHGPVLYIMGGPKDIAYNNAMDDFSRVAHVPIVMTNFDVGHAGTYARPHGGEFTQVALDWLDWQLKGKTENSQVFLGEDGKLAKDPDWTVEAKNFAVEHSKAVPVPTEGEIGHAVKPPAAPEGWSEGFLYANGVRLHYYQTPSLAEKPPLVMVHGITDNGLCWTTLALKLQDQFNITLLDARGHGLSDPFTANDDADTLIKDVVAAVETLELKRPILMGHSMGAHTVMRIAAEYPQLPKAVVMLDPLLPGAGNRGGPPRSGRDEFRGRERSRGEPGEHPTSPESNERSSDRPAAKRLSVSMFGSPKDLVAQNNYSFDDLVAKCRRDSPKWDLIDCQYWALSKKQYHGAYSGESFAVMTGAMQIGDALKNIEVPALILKADASDEDREAHQTSADAMPNCKLVHLDDAGHNLHHDQLNRTFKTLSQFLSKVNGP